MTKNCVSGITESNCAGCSACAAVCPKKCISMVENNRGFIMPLVDENKCIKCGICLNKCPEISLNNLNDNICAFAATTVNPIVLNESTSGGVFYELAKSILEENGIVCGCSWCNDGVEHICIDKIEDINKIQKSKYVQSNIGNVYDEIKQYISQEKKVLFCGTACQIAGVKKFLNDELDLLTTVEVVCHGVPSPGLFKKYRDWLEKKYNKKIEVYNFRTKKFHKKGEHFKSQIIFTDKTEKSIFMNKDPYYYSFIQGKTLRRTCYKCKYKGKRRISDISLCDFWGIEKEISNFPSDYGASAILINSKKGMRLLDKSMINLKIIETTIDAVAKSNPSLYHSTKKCNELDYCLNDQCVIDKLVPKYTLANFLKNHMPEKLKNFIKKYL